MNRLSARLDTLRSRGRKALIPYLTAGDPHPRDTVRILHALVAGGADVIELGVPFSDPMADGPVIQLACERALASGTTLLRVLEMVAEFRRDDDATPVVLMGYLNPIERMGLESFADRAREAGVDGVLIVDLPVEEAPERVPPLQARGLDCIFLVAPTSSPARIQAIASVATGYLYYVSLKGVTGAAHLDAGGVAEKLAEIRRFTSLPVAVGFGIRDPESAARVAAVADGVVVGSALVGEIAAHQETPERLPEILAGKLGAMRSALDAVGHQPGTRRARTIVRDG